MSTVTEWIEHDGKGRPNLPLGTYVHIRTREGKGEGWGSDPIEYWSADDGDPRDYWTAKGDPFDIVLYRLATASNGPEDQ